MQKLRIWQVLVIILVLLPDVFSEQSGRDVLALEKIEVIFTGKEKPKIKIPQQKFRNKKIDALNTEAINQEILQQLKIQAYFLATLDSSAMKDGKQKGFGIYQLFITIGPQFKLLGVDWLLSDSLQEDYYPAIDEKVRTFYNRPYTDELQRVLLRSVIEIFENSGYPLCKIKTEGFMLDSLETDQMGIRLILQIEEGSRVKLAGLRVPANSDISVRFLERVFRFRQNEFYDENRIERYTRLLRKQDFIKSAEKIGLVYGLDSLYYLQLIFEKSPSTTLDGVVGYIPPPVNDPSQNGYFTGLFNIGLKNLFGTGRRLDVYWQKPDRYSEDFRVRYREPFLLGLPFHIGGTLHRLVRDTTYIEWEYSLNAEIPLSENLSGFARFYSREVFPDSLASLQLRLPQTRALHSELGLRWDTRDEPFNPKGGQIFSLFFDYGTQKNVGPAYLVQEDTLIRETDVTKVRGEVATFLQIFRNQVLSLHFHGILIGYQGTVVRPPDMFWFGGATTVRGYRENQFFGEKVGWLNSEYRFLIGPRSRLFVFGDFSYYSRKHPEFKEEFLVGYGAGISFPGPLGILQVDYGLAKGLSFSEGKIHFRIINEF
ncbi:MAG: BamA/TamA family outer membrane protein [bacterium]|nr:MAG: BamA/TamA family outer membrane protein [bacterium]